MRLTPRQASRISDIIQEEVRSVVRGRRKPTLAERIEVMNVDMAVISDATSEKLAQAAHEFAAEALYDFRKAALKIIADELNTHAVSHENVTAAELDAEIEEMDDMLNDDEMELAVGVANQLITYAERLGELAVSMTGGVEADER